MPPMMQDVLIHLAFVLILPPFLLGVINKTKAAFAGRVGPPVFQLYYDLFKLFRKEMVFSETTTWVFRAGPVVGLVTALGAALIVPLGHHRAPVSFPGDMILLVYLLALGRFFTASAALDTGSPFEGMGAARDVTFSCLAEPALFFGFVVMAKLTGEYSLSGMMTASIPLGSTSFPLGSTALPLGSTALPLGSTAIPLGSTAIPLGSTAIPLGSTAGFLFLVAASWFIVLLAENCRIPFDDPNTHLELTMIHEVMVLDHSGPLFGMILYGAAVKLFVMGALLANVAIPIQLGTAWMDWSLFLASMLAIAVLIGVVESTMARLRLVNIPKLLVSACLLSAFGVIFLLKG